MLPCPFAPHLTDSAGRGAQPFGGFCAILTFSVWGHMYFCIKALVGGCPLPTAAGAVELGWGSGAAAAAQQAHPGTVLAN